MYCILILGEVAIFVNTGHSRLNLCVKGRAALQITAACPSLHEDNPGLPSGRGWAATK